MFAYSAIVVFGAYMRMCLMQLLDAHTLFFGGDVTTWRCEVVFLFCEGQFSVLLVYLELFVI